MLEAGKPFPCSGSCVQSTGFPLFVSKSREDAEHSFPLQASERNLKSFVLTFRILYLRSRFLIPFCLTLK